RRRIMGLSIVVMAICGAAMALLAATGLISPFYMLAILVLFGIGRAFLGPASSSLVVALVPTKDFANAVTWNSSAWQGATIIGPAVGGLLLTLGESGFTGWVRGNGLPDLANLLTGRGPEIAYIAAFIFMLVGAVLIFAIPKPRSTPPKERPTLSN